LPFLTRLPEVKELRREARDLKEVVAEQTLELRLLKKTRQSRRFGGVLWHRRSHTRQAYSNPHSFS